MASARPTPRYSRLIEAAPEGPALLRPSLASPAEQPPQHAGPQLVGGSAWLASAARARAASDGVLPLTPRRTAGAGDMPAAVGASPATVRRPVLRVVPVERRPWRVMIVSAAPGASPRSFEVSRWLARTVLGAAILAALLASALVAVLVIAVRSPDPLSRNEVQALEAALAATQDSLSVAREPKPVSPPVASVAPPSPVAPVVKAAAPAVKKEHASSPLAAKEMDIDLPSDGVLNVVPRSLADLPVIGAMVSGFSRARRHPILHRVRPHLGVDLAAPRGTRVSAPAAGVVSFVGHRLGFGLVVELDHGAGVVTRYAHLRSAAVQAGETVRRGEAIAAVGTSGRTTGPHLHYEVMVHGRQVDPLRVRFGRADSSAGPVLAGHPVSAATSAGAAPAPAAAHEGSDPAAGDPPR